MPRFTSTIRETHGSATVDVTVDVDGSADDAVALHREMLNHIRTAPRPGKIAFPDTVKETDVVRTDGREVHWQGLVNANIEGRDGT